MSIVRLSNLAAARTVARSLGSRRGPTGPAPGRTPVDGQSAAAAALDAVVAYIPTEIVTVYVAVIAALNTPRTTSHAGEWFIFWLFLALAPISVWSLYVMRLRADGVSIPGFRNWPLYELVTAPIAFVLWAFTLPASPFMDFGWYRPSQGTAALLVGALILGLCSPLVRQPDPLASQVK